MRKQAVINKDPEGRDQGVTLDRVEALTMFPNDQKTIREPRRVPDGADQERR